MGKDVITVGSRVRASWEEAKPLLVDQSLRLERYTCHLEGVVRHLVGNHPTQPTLVRLRVQPDPAFDPGFGLVCEECDDLREVEINPAWVTDVILEEPAAPKPPDPPASDVQPCDHGLLFNEQEAQEMTTAEIRQVINSALGRLFLMGSRPGQPGDDMAYHKIKGVVLDGMEALRDQGAWTSRPGPYVPCASLDLSRQRKA